MAKDKIIIGLPPGSCDPLYDMTGRLVPQDEIDYDPVNYGVVVIDTAIPEDADEAKDG